MKPRVRILDERAVEAENGNLAGVPAAVVDLFTVRPFFGVLTDFVLLVVVIVMVILVVVVVVAVVIVIVIVVVVVVLKFPKPGVDRFWWQRSKK